VREKLLVRTREYLRNGYGNFERWCRDHSDLFSLTPPDAAAIAFVRYYRDASSSEIVRRLIDEQDTYVVPGDHFGLDHHLRISYGLSKEYVDEGLRRIVEVVASAGQ
jgi:aspartate/methionine/tyrosine aminotransferase